VLSQIIEMVRVAQSSKPAIGRLADKVASVFVPTVMIIAVVTFLAWFNFGPAEQGVTLAVVTAMTVLIIACPCALGLATPISIMVGVGKAAEFGILIRNGDALQQTGRLDTIILDKTGTVTEGKPSVTEIIPAGDWSEEEILRWGASVEQGSEHPLAEAIVDTAGDRQVSLLKTERFAAVAGRGVEATVDGKQVILGNHKLMRERNIDISSIVDAATALTHKAQTPMFVAVAGDAVGIISVADAIKEDSKEAIQRLHDLGLRVVLLTGDNEATAKAVARQVGIDQVFAEVLPKDKAEMVASLQQQGQ